MIDRIARITPREIAEMIVNEQAYADTRFVLATKHEAEIERLRARVEVLEQHLRDAVSVADMAMSDANGCDCRTEKKWDREAELEVFRAALEATQ